MSEIKKDGNSIVVKPNKDLVASVVSELSDELRPLVQSDPKEIVIDLDGVDMVEDTDYTVDYDTGIITFDTAPASEEEVLIDECEFHVHARFDTDKLDSSHDFWLTESWPDIPIVEIKE